jgi:hypothetical protein
MFISVRSSYCFDAFDIKYKEHLTLYKNNQNACFCGACPAGEPQAAGTDG